MKTILMIVFLLPSIAFAAELVTRDGQVYKNYTVSGTDWDGVRISYADGVAKIPFEELPAEIQQKYHYNPAKVAALRKAMADAAQKAEIERKNAMAQAVEMARKQEEAAKEQANREKMRQEQAAQEQVAQENQQSDQTKQDGPARDQTAAERSVYATLGAIILLYTVIYTVVFGGIGALIGHYAKGRAKLGFLLGFLLSWIGWIITLLVSDHRYKCPRCLSPISVRASVCPRCQTEFV